MIVNANHKNNTKEWRFLWLTIALSTLYFGYKPLLGFCNGHSYPSQANVRIATHKRASRRIDQAVAVPLRCSMQDGIECCLYEW